MVDSNLTEILCILDESSSMSGLQESTISGFNEFLSEQKSQPGRANLTLVTFNTKVLTVYSSRDIQLIEPIDTEVYSPNGRTALLDAVGRTIDEAGKRFAARSEDDKPANVITFVTTDGEENASDKYSIDDVSSRVDEQQRKYGWEFIFTGANIDEFAAGQSMNFNQDRIGGFDHDKEGVTRNFQAMTAAANQMRATGQVQDDWDAQLSTSGGTTDELDGGETSEDDEDEERVEQMQQNVGGMESSGVL
jgi:hypothetical protein